MAEFFVGAAEVKSLLAARKAAMEAAMLRSRVIANIEQNWTIREASRIDEYLLNERKLMEDLAAKRAAEGTGYTGGRTQKELDDLAGDPSHGGAIREQGIKEREIGLDLEKQGKLGRVVRDPQGDGGAEFIDTTSGLKWDVKSFESYPNGHTSPKKGAFTVENGMKSINKELSKGYNVIVDTRNLIPEQIDQLREAIQKAGIIDRIIWYS
uniref:Uncharacterized protein n=1 Tax=Paenibacillus athensensis TaxID=1967502 RepID=A0A4Y8PTV4_9BACL